ncbi:MAG: hypothetical protein WC635_18010 [Bacteriovorax sp.]
MRSLSVFLFIVNIINAQAYGAGVCTADEIARFKAEYVKLQNALKAEGKSIELKNGKAVAVAGTEGANPEAQKVEEALYNQYKNALIKVGKIYQKINNEPTDANKKLLNDNPDISKFFQAIDPKNTDRKITDKLNLENLLLKLKKIKIPGFELQDEDTYLLNKLIVHAQDRICTLEKYSNSKKRTKLAYLEQLHKSPLNKIIESLKTLSGQQDLKLVNEEVTISEAVKSSMAQLRKIIKENKNCENKLKFSPQLGDRVQSCNYNKFIKSLSANQFNEIEAILHFLNANQLAKNARTGLDWINTQFSSESPTSCYNDPETKAIYVQNLPFVNGKKIDASKISCTKGTTSLKPEDCIKGMRFDFEDSLGMKVSSKKIGGADAVTSFSIKGSADCNNVNLSSAAVPPPVPPAPPQEEPPKLPGPPPAEEPPAPPAPPVEESKICDEAKCGTMTGDGLIEWSSADQACYLKPVIGSGQTKLCGTTGSPAGPSAAELECNKDTKKIWKDNTCKDVTPPVLSEEECKKDTKKEWKDNACKDVTPSVLSEEECKKDTKKTWKDNKCIDNPSTDLSAQDKCKKKDDDWTKGGDASEVRTSRYIWDGKTCKDKQSKASEGEDDSAVAKPEVVYPNKPVPGRFQPIVIPTRQIFILPGMP